MGVESRALTARKRFGAASAALAVLVTLGGVLANPDAAEPRPGLDRLTTEDGKIVDPEGRPVLLRGVNLLALREDGKSVPSSEYRRIRRAGFTVVRLVAYWDALEPRPPDASGRHVYAPAAVAKLDEAVARARAAGLWAVIDPVHLFDLSPAFGGRGIPSWVYRSRRFNEARARATIADDDFMHGHLEAFLRFIAARYGRDPTVAAIDPINEPPTADVAKTMDWYAEMVGQIRAGAPETIVLVEPRYGDSSITAEDLRRIEDRRNLVLSPHFYYGGGAGSGYGARGEQAPSGRYLWDGKTGYPGGAAGEMRAHLDVSLEAARGAGMPVWIGEFGIGRDVRGAKAWVRDATNLFEATGVGWSYWVHDSTDDFSLTTSRGTYGPLARRLSDVAR